METILNTFGTQMVVDLEDTSSVAAARRAGAVLAKGLKFDEVRAGQLALVVTEASTNILKHAGRGQVLLRTVRRGDISGVEVLALDNGPGIGDLGWYVEDGNSSAGTYGIGLGAVRRLSQTFDMYSLAGKGTVLWMIIWSINEAPASGDWDIGAICLPINGEEVSGDCWGMAASEKGLTLIVADGLGHGLDAAIASNAAMVLQDDIVARGPAAILQRAHLALHGTRGAAVAVSQIDTESSALGFAGIGNISVCILYPEDTRHLMSHNGIVGSNMRKVQEFSERWEHEAVLVAHSDGINTRWDLSAYPGLLDCHPALIAAVIYRDFSRGRDDTAVVVVRESSSRPSGS